MRFVPLLALATLSPFLAQAQSGRVTSVADPRNAQSAVVLQTPTSNGCPVGFGAQHAQGGAVVEVSPGSHRAGQSYLLTLSPTADHVITKAEITLHGLAGQHVLLAAANKGGDVNEHITISPWTGKDHHFHSAVYTDKLTAVQWIELNGITYADGTQWHESATATCRVAPNGYMLVAQD